MDESIYVYSDDICFENFFASAMKVHMVHISILDINHDEIAYGLFRFNDYFKLVVAVLIMMTNMEYEMT